MITAEVRALLQELQDRRKSELDAHRRDVQFAVGTRCCSTRSTRRFRRSSCFPRVGWAPSESSLFKVLARTAPNTYRLELPGAWRAFDESNVERLRPYRPSHRPTEGAAAAGPRPLVSCYRSCSSSSFATAGPTFSCAGRAATRRATRGSQTA